MQKFVNLLIIIPARKGSKGLINKNIRLLKKHPLISYSIEAAKSLKEKNKILQDLETSIKKKKNVISDEAYNKEVIDFKKKFQEFSKEKNEIVKEFNIFKKKEIENIFKKINPIINDYMEENSVNLLFDSKNIFMGAKKLNLTEDVLKKINNELK